jgi:molybdenum cofactor guanylyltransferase
MTGSDEALKLAGDKYLGLYHHGEPVNAFVLAGGLSTRMGRDKAFLQLGGLTLLERALEVATSATGTAARIVGQAGKFGIFGTVIEDVYPDCGPLGGIHAALAQTSTDLNLMLAVDLPFVRLEFLSFLLAQARKATAIAVVPRAGGGLQPLCAVYRRSFGEVAERSLRAGRNKVEALFREVQTQIVEPQELKQNNFSEEMFRNLNTPEEWEEAASRASELGLQTSGLGPQPERPDSEARGFTIRGVGKGDGRPTTSD